MITAIAVLIFLIMVVLVLFWYVDAIEQLTEMRDEADLTTIRGQAVKKAANEELEKLYGLNLWKRYKLSQRHRLKKS